jgi:hypothetical protein
VVQALTDLPPGVFGFRVSGRATSEDLDQVTQAVDAQLARDGKLNAYVELTDDFEGFDQDALRRGRQEAIRFGFRHRSRFGRLALVTSNDWVRDYVNGVASLIPGEVHVFGPSDRGLARAWVAHRRVA